jgi:hypothetical protein
MTAENAARRWLLERSTPPQIDRLGDLPTGTPKLFESTDEILSWILTERGRLSRSKIIRRLFGQSSGVVWSDEWFKEFLDAAFDGLSHIEMNVWLSIRDASEDRLGMRGNFAFGQTFPKSRLDRTQQRK